MVSSVSKKYTKALCEALDDTRLQAGCVALQNIAQALKLGKFSDILHAHEIDETTKAQLVFDIAQTSDEVVKSLIKVLMKAKRMDIIPAIIEEISNKLSLKSGKAEGIVKASFDLDKTAIDAIAASFGKKCAQTISLSFEKDVNLNGIKVEVDTLGVEAEIKKETVTKALVAHILNTNKIF